MGMISTGDNSYTPAAETGGRLSFQNFIQPPRSQAMPAPNILESVEKILSNPAMQPIITQAGRLIGEYANKLTLDNQERLSKMQNKSAPGNAPATNQHTVVFGAGSENE